MFLTDHTEHVRVHTYTQTCYYIMFFLTFIHLYLVCIYVYIHIYVNLNTPVKLYMFGWCCEGNNRGL